MSRAPASAAAPPPQNAKSSSSNSSNADASSSSNNNNNNNKKKKKKNTIPVTVLIMAGTCLFALVSFSLLHWHMKEEAMHHQSAAMSQSIPLLSAEAFKQLSEASALAATHEMLKQRINAPRPVKPQPPPPPPLPLSLSQEGPPRDKNDNDHHELGGLSCRAFPGGPSDEDAQREMVYWSDIPSDAMYKSPFWHHHQQQQQNGEAKYMTFEPDGGGWNNIRMAMETIVAMAHAMGRILVMPPAQKMYLLGKDGGRQRTHFHFADFFHLDSLEREHPGLEIISTEQFLQQEAMTGRLVNQTTGLPQFPPGNRTNWDGEDPKELKEYLRQVTYLAIWRPGNCLAAFPAQAGSSESVQGLRDMMTEIQQEHGRNFLVERNDDDDNSPLAVNAPAKDRLREALAGRQELCIYDFMVQEAPVVHFMCYHKWRVRMLVHFYAFLYFEDWRQDLWTKRFVRDHLRYMDELQCAAARVVLAIRERVRGRHAKDDNANAKDDDNNDTEAHFDAMHVRRGDFQFKATRIEAQELYETSKDVIPQGATVYIATDERNKAFFDPLRQHWNLLFLDDFRWLLEGLNTNYYGMLDQLIASRARYFFGTYHSTFTGYINRMRGYYIDKHRLPGHEDGTMESYYFVPSEKKQCMKRFTKLSAPFFSREFPISWRDLDFDVDMEKAAQ